MKTLESDDHDPRTRLVDNTDSEDGGGGLITAEGWDQMTKRLKIEFNNAKAKGKAPQKSESKVCLILLLFFTHSQPQKKNCLLETPSPHKPRAIVRRANRMPVVRSALFGPLRSAQRQAPRFLRRLLDRLLSQPSRHAQTTRRACHSRPLHGIKKIRTGYIQVSTTFFHPPSPSVWTEYPCISLSVAFSASFYLLIDLKILLFVILPLAFTLS